MDNAKMALALSKKEKYEKLLTMVVERRPEEISIQRGARAMLVLQHLMSAWTPGELDCTHMKDDAARRGSKRLQLAYLEDYLCGKGRIWPPSLYGTFPCERCCKATANLCPCGKEVNSICLTCMALNLRCIDCPDERPIVDAKPIADESIRGDANDEGDPG